MTPGRDWWTPCRRLCRFGLAVALVGCGMDSDRSPVVTIEPPAVDLTLLQPQTFTASIPGIDGAAVDWSVSGGTIMASSATSLNYRAPDRPGEVRIHAVSRLDPTVEASATVRVSVPEGVTVGVGPSRVQVAALGEQTWVASVLGTYMPAVDWSCDGGAFVSQDDGSARWMAPATPGNYRIVATSRANPAASAAGTAEVSLAGGSAPLVLWITPAEATVDLGGSASFTLGFSTNEMPGVDVSVSWAATGGTLETGSSGVVTYTAASRGQQLVTAQSNRYPSVAASASVFVR